MTHRIGVGNGSELVSSAILILNIALIERDTDTDTDTQDTIAIQPRYIHDTPYIPVDSGYLNMTANQSHLAPHGKSKVDSVMSSNIADHIGSLALHKVCLTVYFVYSVG
jgi:hypothetical protein